MGRGTESRGVGAGAGCTREGEDSGFRGETLSFLPGAILTSHLDGETEAGGPGCCPTLAGVEACVGRVCSPDAEDAAGSFGSELQALACLHRLSVMAPGDQGTSSGQFTAQYHRLPGGHAEWARGCLWGKELDRGLWTESGYVNSVTPPAPASQTWAGQEHPPARLTLKVTASSRVSHTYSPASSDWA